MTDQTEAGGEALPQQKNVRLSAIAEEMALEADYHRNRKLHRAAQVDELTAKVDALTAELEQFSTKKKGAGNGDPA